MSAQRPATSARIAGAACVLLALACALHAAAFRVRFITDPVGPRALPWLAAALIGTGGLLLLLRPGPPTDSFRSTTLRRTLLAFAGFFAYAALIEVLGFILSTTLLVTLLALLFDGRPLHAVFAAAAIAVLIWLTFVSGLGVPLPVGTLFLRGG
jgi:putative tricarboxylic transport membrane protein